MIYAKAEGMLDPPRHTLLRNAISTGPDYLALDWLNANC